MAGAVPASMEHQIMSNYPDNIRGFDDDPRSPFYIAPEGEECPQCCEPYDVSDACQNCDYPNEEERNAE